jgi:DNA polymerase
MFIGEGPGFYENEQGRPFVGAAGKFLDELLERAQLGRKSVFITNVVKCRPPGNRDPLPEELLACSDYLERQIAAINPLVIVTLGRFSMSRFLPNVRISEVHGQPAWVRGRLVVPMFHPAAALHQPSLKTSVERDFARLPEWIQQARQNGSAAAHSTSSPAASPEASTPRMQPAQKASTLFQASLLLPETELEAEEQPVTSSEDEDISKKKDSPTQLSLF